ncbi:MAG: nitrate reductase cytochrome c-type subunit [Gammaproteobacteria bacterium]|nr:nitrate reductase cytochrome c-type subunit [Gammaproteobacteria bacterium]
MKKSLTTSLAVLAVLSTAAFSTPASADSAEMQTLRAADVAVPDRPPEEMTQLGARPGTQKPIARTFKQQPPLIPHATANFDEITLEENQCLSCHDVTTYKKKNAPRIGDSHFRDSKGKLQKVMVRTRYNCQQCHVPQVDAQPLVENIFKGIPVTTAPQ